MPFIFDTMQSFDFYYDTKPRSILLIRREINHYTQLTRGDELQDGADWLSKPKALIGDWASQGMYSEAAEPLV
jgi:hypothetical protein